MGVLGKYLLALSGSFSSTPPPGAPSKPTGSSSNVSASKVSPKRKRLHIFYLLNDLLHHTKYHGDTSAAFSMLSGSLQPYLVELFGLAASFEREKNPKHHKRLNEVLDIWADSGYYSEEYVNKLREAVENSASVDAIKASLASVDDKAGVEKPLPVKDAPFVMPATHGDPSTPYYDLPAGNLMPHIIPNSSTPIRPEAVKPLQFLSGPADETLVKALKTFLKDVDNLYNTSDTAEDEEVVVDMDALGQTITRDKITGEIICGESYYGWSRDFCQKMKKRREEGERSRSRNRSQSSSPRKRRRYSDSVSSDGRSPSRDPSRRRRNYSDSRSPPPRATHHGSRSASRSRSRSYSPEAPPSQFQQRRSFQPPPPPPVPQMPFNGDQSFNPPPPPLGPGGLLVPPPRPPNYQGPWPPPPPPPPPSHSPPQPGGFPNMPMNMNMPGFPTPHFQQQQGGQSQFSPPPPPPPPQMHHNQGQMQMQMQPGAFPFPPPFGQTPQQHQHHQHHHQQQDPWRQPQMGNSGNGGGRGGYYPPPRGRGGRGWH